MIIVKAFFNTDTEGRRVDTESLALDDLPQCWYGPFDDISEAVSFMENDYPDGDTDLYEMIANDFEVPEGTFLNDPMEWRKQFEEDDIRDE